MRLINQNRTGQPWVKPGNDGCASSRRMRRYREPFPVLLRPAIGVAPVRLLSVRRGVTERRMQTAKPVAIKNLQAHDVKIRIMGDFAIIHPAFSYTTPDGQQAHGRYTDCWAKQNGKYSRYRRM